MIPRIHKLSVEIVFEDETKETKFEYVNKTGLL